ncbi:hypothetical protein MJO29_013152 [Puccinia striiformis f. sp. tritici]|uniref:hypothetical protein n=1 Tax=Puccinia striiformis f. sp. tritici TaxID=168172 RepID=UPI002007E698|nr:hypothetical protein Pst134EA_024592 [Puccinia striiformis f. sp. tritici]KAH9453731.1 hypothetical protein Pst134EA_024592 [Puccinia striiformis f. sp. tritici]KAI7943308.1 hypothetical protein MJO29_013152 [Puccinia striiformis f. sp. tritici]
MNGIRVTLLACLAGICESVIAFDQNCGGSPGAEYACAHFVGAETKLFLSPRDQDCQQANPKMRYCCPRGKLNVGQEYTLQFALSDSIHCEKRAEPPSLL